MNNYIFNFSGKYLLYLKVFLILVCFSILVYFQTIELKFNLLLLFILLSFAIFEYLIQIQTTNLLIQEIEKFSKENLQYKFKHNNEIFSKVFKQLNSTGSLINSTIKKIKTEQNKSEIILNSMNEAVLALDYDGKIVKVNSAFTKLFNLKSESILGKIFFETIVNAEFHDFIKNLKKIDNSNTEISFVNNNGTKYFLKLTGNKITTKNKEFLGYIIVISNITEIKKLERIRSDFVANVSHELKTPLTIIKISSETLINTLDCDTQPFAKKFVNKILFQANRMEQIIEDLLVLSKLENNNKHIEVSGQKLASLIRQSVKNIEDIAVKRNISIQTTLDDNIFVKVNPVLIIQAFYNLLDNAVKYGNENSIVKITTKLQKNNVDILFEDESNGIEHIHLERLFERFYRVDKGRSKKAGGTGLGLSIVKHIVNIHDGKVAVSSTPGKGSIFTINLPVVK